MEKKHNNCELRKNLTKNFVINASKISENSAGKPLRNPFLVFFFSFLPGAAPPKMFSKEVSKIS